MCCRWAATESPVSPCRRRSSAGRRPAPTRTTEVLFDEFKSQLPDIDPEETREWVEAIEQVVAGEGAERARRILWDVLQRARELNVGLPALTQTPYINTIPLQHDAEVPGD